MKTTNWTSILFSLYAASTLIEVAAAQPMSCTEAYRDALADVNTGQSINLGNSVAYDKYCSASGTLNKSSFSGAIDTILEEVPIKASLQGANSEQKMEQFCKLGFQQNGFYSNDVWYAKTIVLGAQKNLNECKRMESAGLLITHQYTAPKYITISGRYLNKNSQATLDALTFDPKEVSCSSASFNKKGAPITFHEKYPSIVVENDFTIQCKRIGAIYKKKTFFPATSIVLSISKVNTDTYSISLPAEDSYGPELSSQANRKIEELDAKNKDLVKQITALNSERETLASRLANAKVIDVVTWSSGEPNNFPGPRFNSSVPNDFGSYINSQCKNKPLPAGAAEWLGQFYGVANYGGGPHGTTYFIGTCLAK
jgi:hypothetical protein